MAKVLVIICLLLVATLSKAAPILDEEVDNDFDENEENDDDVQDESEEKTNENDDDYDTTKTKDDDYVDNDEEGDLKGKEDEDEDDEGDNDNDDNEVEVVEERRGEKRAQYLEDDGDDDDDDDDTGEEGEKSRDMTLDDRTVDAAARVVEDFGGKMALEKKSDRRDDEDDTDDEEETDGGDFKDMGQQISKLKKIFNEDMPREIEELKSNSKTLRDDLDNLNAKLENFLRDNGIKQDPAVPQSNEEYDYDV